jgi:hypothetical protein
MTDHRLCIVGLDEPEHSEILSHLFVRSVAHEALPRIYVEDGELFVESRRGPHFVSVSAVVFHGIYEDDLDFIAGLALWGGPCLPSARAMMDCRLRLPCLVRALEYTRFGAPVRSYVAPGTPFASERERVAKWGNWHCGENKARFTGVWRHEEACLVEPFLEGRAVRVTMIGERYWQIRLEGEGWLKSIHSPAAEFMEPDPELVEDTDRVRRGFGLELIANDYIVAADGSKHLLEVNHIPNVTRFPEIWAAYRDYVVAWVSKGGPDRDRDGERVGPRPA